MSISQAYLFVCISFYILISAKLHNFDIKICRLLFTIFPPFVNLIVFKSKSKIDVYEDVFCNQELNQRTGIIKSPLMKIETSQTKIVEPENKKIMEQKQFFLGEGGAWRQPK